MLTLYEAIVRFEAVSKANRSRAESYNRGEDYELMKAKECETCADECEQVASWLTELLDRREADRWISVKERLPEEKINPNTNDFVEVLCTTIFGDVRTYKYGTPIGHEQAHFWYGFGIFDNEVIAWRPLPEPYKESEGE